MRNWKQWSKKAGVRAIKTTAQTAVAMIGVSSVMSDVNCSPICKCAVWHFVIID